MGEQTVTNSKITGITETERDTGLEQHKSNRQFLRTFTQIFNDLT